MSRLKATIPHPDAHRLVHTPRGHVEIVENEIETEDQDVIHFLLRNDFVLVDDAVQPASTNPSASATKDAGSDGAAMRAQRRNKKAE